METPVAPAGPFRGSYLRGAMGTVARIVVWAPDEASAVEAARKGFALIDTIEASLTDWKPTSETAAASRAAGGPPLPVGALFLDAVAVAKAAARATDGAFDPTIAPVVALWRTARKTGTLPAPEARDAAVALRGWREIALDRVRGTVRLPRPGMALDFGGIGKGYAADRVVALLRASGFPACLCEIGGDFAMGEPPPDAAGWRIGTHATPPLVVANRGVATSGDTEQHVDIDGVRWSHIVDPDTGLGVAERRLVTVVADDGATADAWATALSVLGPERGFARLPKNVEARIVVRPGLGTASENVYETPGYRKLSASR